jgi:alpha-tubulin suppressor-like RCC1 family protein
LLLVLSVSLSLGFSRNASAACASPPGNASELIYNGATKQFQYCNDTQWIAAHHPGDGSGGCTNPARDEGHMLYNSGARVMQGCAGDDWRPMGLVGGKGKWQHVAAGAIHACAIKADGTLWCWGSDWNGRLGNGADGDQDSPDQESTAATDWASVSAGNHTCAIKTDGTLWCWGWDGGGQLGNGAVTDDQDSPDQEATAATDWATVSAGYEHTCAIKTDGTLWCWGSDWDGRLGNGADGDQDSPDQESTAATDWASVSAGPGHTCAIKTDGTLWCWGGDWGGRLGNGADGNQDSPDQESTAATDWATVSAGTDHTCAIKTDGTVWCWGYDGHGRLGNGADGDQDSPDQESTAATDWATVSAGREHTCAIKTDGTLWCWGSDGDGRLGNGADGAQNSPDQESTAATDWATVSAGYSHTCAIKTNGTLWCWGRDADGALGNGGLTGNQQSPSQESTAASNWASVVTGDNYTCALKTNGTIWCWGDDDQGQLGNGAESGAQISPMQELTQANDWAAVSALVNHTCAVKTNGALWCWGHGRDGKLGNGATLPIQNIECMNPPGLAGTMLYNSDNNVMQYCDGVSWAVMGVKGP